MGHPQKQEKADPPVSGIPGIPPESTKRTSRALGMTAIQGLVFVRRDSPQGHPEREERASPRSIDRGAKKRATQGMTTGKDAGLKPGATLKAKTRIRTHPSRTTRRMGHPQKQEKADPSRQNAALGMTALCDSASKRDSSSAPGGLRMTIAGVRLMRGARRQRFRGRWLWRVSRHRGKRKAE
jgi:hypothetical protein